MKIRIETDTPEFAGDIADVVRLFFGEESAVFSGGDALLRHAHREEDGLWTETAEWLPGGARWSRTGEAASEPLEARRRRKRLTKQACYDALKAAAGRKPAWGSLTGIRPTRLYYRELEQGRTPLEAEARLIGEYDLDPEKARPLTEIVRAQEPSMGEDPSCADLYVGIPFCVTRCAYCSFSSGVIGDGKLVEPYLAALGREIDAAAEMARASGLRTEVGYMGGGTPSSLSAPQLDALLTRIERRFPGMREWTVEAGRPDTLDEEKLRMLRDHPVTRISINPQTMNDETLERIGRRHTARETEEAFALARRLGFDDINMDVIAALPGETQKMFERTLAGVRRLSPECLTVHTLAVKRSSRLHEERYRQQDERAAQMVRAARACASDLGMRPYYLYRQKYMADNLENVGYSLPGRECRYNIDNMEEIRSVLALGAGGISKRLLGREKRILRIPNVSNIAQYIERIDGMIGRKRAFFSPAPGEEEARFDS